MPQVIQGELSRHHDKPFYAQQQRPRLFWSGCLIPAVILAVVAFFVLKGLTTSGGLELVRGFILVVILFVFAQMIFGGTIFARTRSSLGKGLLLGALMLLLLLVLALFGLASAVSNFIG